jgi:ribosome-binding ATPase
MPNVGKSTLFNALTETQSAQAANYPFCELQMYRQRLPAPPTSMCISLLCRRLHDCEGTIEPNIGVVSVPDPKIDVLAKINKSEKTVPAALEFVDVAGLIKGAASGEVSCYFPCPLAEAEPLGLI